MQMNNFSERLKEERIRLDLSQAELGELCGVKKLAQFNYEKGERFPDANYLMQAILIGVDVNYLLTGQRSSNVLPTDEVLILEKYRQASPMLRNQMLMLLLGGDSEATKSVVNDTGNYGNGYQLNGKNQTINNAPVTTKKTSIKIGKQHGDVVNGDKNVKK